MKRLPLTVSVSLVENHGYSSKKTTIPHPPHPPNKERLGKADGFFCLAIYNVPKNKFSHGVWDGKHRPPHPPNKEETFWEHTCKFFVWGPGGFGIKFFVRRGAGRQNIVILRGITTFWNKRNFHKIWCLISSVPQCPNEMQPGLLRVMDTRPYRWKAKTAASTGFWGVSKCARGLLFSLKTNYLWILFKFVFVFVFLSQVYLHQKTRCAAHRRTSVLVYYFCAGS